MSTTPISDLTGVTIGLGRPALHGPELLGISTGFEGIDLMTHGLQPGHLAVIASRPSMGRTTLLTSVIHGVALGGTSTLVITLEETAKEFVTRLMCSVGRVGHYQLQRGNTTDEDRRRLDRAQATLDAAPLQVCADPSLTMEELAKLARAAVRDGGVKFIAVDGLTDIKPEKRHDLREREVGDIARDLKTLARELNVPILVTTHLNRIPESRPNKIPKLDDLRESGAVTFAADWIVLLFRPDYYERESPRAGEIDLIVAKNRFGPLGQQTAAVQFHYCRIVEMAQS